MKRFTTIVSLLALFAAAVTAAEQQCSPLKLTAKPDKPVANPLVSVYWDVSGSVDRRFDTHVNFLIANLDSRILPLAGAGAPIRHYAVGKDIVEAQDAEVAKSRHQMRSDLHDAVRNIAADLARGEIGAAILVTDMEVDRPDVSQGVNSICGDVPIPTDRGAGPLIGRCFSAGWRLAPAKAGHPKAATIDHLLLTIFRSRYAADIAGELSRKHLYIVVFATDVDFGRKILSGLEQRLPSITQGYEQFNLVDTSAAPHLNVGWKKEGLSVRTANGYQGRCAFACFDTPANIELRVGMDLPSVRSWIALQPKPRVTAADGRATPILRAGGWDIKWTLACIEPAHKLQGRRVNLRFDWASPQAIPSTVTIDHPDVEDAITSLVQAVPPLLTPRTYSILVGLR